MKTTTETRFGAIAVDKGFITAGQLIEAFTQQAKENIEKGKHTLLGDILVNKGAMTQELASEVLDAMI
jgi:hypothetical protein